jgi:histidinol-phosphatase (PHP family)
VKVLSNVHTHTLYCDGENTVEEMAAGAVSLGMTTLGFSGHSPLDHPAGSGWAMTPEAFQSYKEDVAAAREKYAGRLEILCGLELDYDSSPEWGRDLDFIIGSVHQLMPDGDFCSVDNVPEEVDDAVNRHFGGCYYSYCAAYYDKLSGICERTGCDIVGHFDIVTKFNGEFRRFDENDPRYRGPAINCLRKLVNNGAVFEINTGGISRGYRTTPYPAPWILREISRLGGSVILTSDAHSAATLLHGFDKGADLAAACGFDSVKALTAKGFIDLPVR